MKKTILSIAMAMFCYAGADAQTTHKPVKASHVPATVRKLNAERMHSAILRQLTGSGQKNTAAKTTATVTEERLIAQSRYSFQDPLGTGISTWMISDSSEYMYTGEHGSYFNLNNMTYVSYYQLYSTSFLGQGQIIGLRDKDNKPEILCDSAHVYTILFADTLETLENVYSVYDAADNITEFTENYVPFSYAAKNKNTFNSAGIASVLYLENNVGTWDTLEHRDLGYTGTQLTHDSTNLYGGGMWSPEYKFVYTYDGAGKATRISQMTYNPPAWFEEYRYDLEYYTTGKLKKMTSSYSDGTTPLAVEEIDSLGWTPGGSFYDYVNAVYLSSGVPTQSYTIKKIVNTITNLPDSVYNLAYDLTTGDTLNNQLTVYTYDTYKNPVIATDYLRSTGSMSYDSVASVSHFYYQLYTRDVTGVGNVTATTSNIHIYPNPATNELNITQSAQATTTNNANDMVSRIKIISIVGQVVADNAFDLSGGNGKIAVDGLPQGSYFVLLQNAQGAIVHKEKFVKL